MAGKKASNGKQLQKVRVHEGKRVEPVLWHGKTRYMAGMIGGNVIKDSKGKPIPYRGIGQLIWEHEINK